MNRLKANIDKIVMREGTMMVRIRIRNTIEAERSGMQGR